MNLRSHTYYIGMQLKKLMVYGFTMKMNVKKLQISLIGWAFDILGWGFSDLAEKLTSCDVVSKHEHFYQFWKSYIKRPMILVGPSLGSAVAIDFVVIYPEAVENLVLIDASVYRGNRKPSNLT
ncbi:uncharacterized protein LOC107644344 isoform X1 [Arachis ipaensis]|uniref:uncharacterized protein LOC107644344 isoform X1 n=1 Tax=Arachis ipaensis TaxID=130454 RepID=UPI000A2B11CE|nr:uncharacterized protein LOC107644344 isoform X1 [Arachis ipaensis]XP_020958579.1 uncharacterized protein LOC107644344 isoform X1 [Arachis ipaensis]XP_020958580.1 uncharacterized protein LOC107644344 isoform X1 [Arachis ipaensis]XP_020958581.1 uncharacterized protein LOC107644344 isoform X1 [Arachis ipaensis]XP_020958582.1 uncharacterized protein LOC107644344 isoform X1 [Arachis ipaensis]XP_020958583.1 uncharacterized protein LOC107644344 isoform X1 [Arachis ipaensis]XP_020958584.1 uncharac